MAAITPYQETSKSYPIDNFEYTFKKTNAELTAECVSKISLIPEIFSVEIQVVIPNECKTLESEIAWLMQNKIPVKIENGKIVFLSPPLLNDNSMKSVKRNLTNYLRLYEKGSAMYRHPAVTDHLRDFLLRDQPYLNFKITSPTQLCAANLYIQELLKKDLLEQIGANKDYIGFKHTVLSSDFPILTNKVNKKISKTVILKQLIVSGFIDDSCKIVDNNNNNAIDGLRGRFGDVTTNKILDILSCISYRSRDELMLLRTTQTRFLDPQILSDMSNQRISHTEACLLLSHLYIQLKKGSPISLIDSKTSIWNQSAWNIVKHHEDFELSVKVESSSPHPDQLYEAWFADEKYTKEIKNSITSILWPFMLLVSDDFKNEFLKELEKTSIHEIYNWFFEWDRWRQKLAQEIRSSDNEDSLYKDVEARLESKIFTLFDKEAQKYNIENSPRERIYYAFDQMVDQIHNSLLHQPVKIKNFDKLMKNVEEASKKTEAIMYGKDQLEKLLSETYHILRIFLKYSTTEITINPITYQFTWDLDGISVSDEIGLQEKGVVSRRVNFPKAIRPDLPYFKTDESIETNWQTLKEKNNLDDKRLARLCLELYEMGHTQTNEDVKYFIAPLVLLLFGKEPSLDRASNLCNYVLFLCVQEGIFSFKKALKLMPMIPQGAVAAKQFLSHVAQLPLDWFSNVQCDKDPKRILPSYFLPYMKEFLGSAADWIEKYDNVVTAFIKYSVHILKNSSQLVSQAHLEKLQQILQTLYNKAIPIAELSFALECECTLMDDDDLVGKWAIEFLTEMHHSKLIN